MRYRLSLDGLFDGFALYGGSWLPGETEAAFPPGCAKPPYPLPGDDTHGMENLALDVLKTLQSSRKMPNHR
jgi:hypothetical protein